ncbi:uncharacterized protein LOC117578159 isoform X2 [Drosophila albomicans]|uniref:Uncharacterized protein LOC117578159 isoform X2 n=1 Tax=Drosophila albomicans TaxID=7291 RepID=A0A6P8XRQ0_DROAB|nr:uncharacterized protein LOC117578159 isoform X2 [Drosophila albomicans]
MFNFHKPRVYRSTDGCCICRAKSSSSRFTASRKYEKESMQCFNLHEPRNGEICNACVLLVKRYKRLPVGSKRHWGHVVDARAGPGTKSLAKQKKRDNDSDTTSGGGGSSSSLPEKFAKIFKKNRKGKITAATTATATASSSIDRELQLQQQLLCKERSPHSEDQPSDSNESNDDEQLQLQHVATTVAATTPYQTRKRTAAAALATASISLSPSSLSSSSSAPSVGSGRQRLRLTGSKRRRMLEPRKNRRAVDNVPFFEEHDLLRLDVCCGTVFQSLSLGSACYIIDPELYKPCEKHRRRGQQQQQQVTEQQKKLLAVQQHQVSSISSATTTLTTPTPSQAPIPTPALKKHHLFFMRQSESFPQGEIHRISPIPLNKTEAMPPTPTQTQTATNVQQQQQQQQHSTLMLKPGVGVTPSVGLLHVGMMTATTATAVAATTNNTTTTTAVGAASPSSLSSSSNCSTSSSVATKFNDNSSDSGFDEHVLERKSVSPPTDELHLQEKKQHQLQQRTAGGGGMQRLILASGLPISGQSQNLVLTGNEFTARFVQTPPQMLKITTTGNASGGVAATAGSQSSGNSNNKMRAIFNSANTIQHENGVTTILPASSLAASNQTAAMNAIAPSTVTITPAAANAKFILLKPSTAIGSKHPTTATTTTPPEVKIA